MEQKHLRAEVLEEAWEGQRLHRLTADLTRPSCPIVSPSRAAPPLTELAIFKRPYAVSLSPQKARTKSSPVHCQIPEPRALPAHSRLQCKN